MGAITFTILCNARANSDACDLRSSLMVEEDLVLCTFGAPRLILSSKGRALCTVCFRGGCLSHVRYTLRVASCALRVASCTSRVVRCSLCLRFAICAICSSLCAWRFVICILPSWDFHFARCAWHVALGTLRLASCDYAFMPAH